MNSIGDAAGLAEDRAVDCDLLNVPERAVDAVDDEIPAVGFLEDAVLHGGRDKRFPTDTEQKSVSIRRLQRLTQKRTRARELAC